MMLLTACSAARPVIDSACYSIREAKASASLRVWLKEQCDASGRCQKGVPGDLPAFVATVAGNNEVLRARCGGTS